MLPGHYCPVNKQPHLTLFFGQFQNATFPPKAKAAAAATMGRRSMIHERGRERQSRLTRQSQLTSGAKKQQVEVTRQNARRRRSRRAAGRAERNRELCNPSLEITKGARVEPHPGIPRGLFSWILSVLKYYGKTAFLRRGSGSPFWRFKAAAAPPKPPEHEMPGS